MRCSVHRQVKGATAEPTAPHQCHPAVRISKGRVNKLMFYLLDIKRVSLQLKGFVKISSELYSPCDYHSIVMGPHP